MIEELQVMQDIFIQQISVVKDCHKALKTLHWSAMPSVRYFGREDGAKHGPEEATLLRESAMDRMMSLIADMEQRREELASMERLQNKTRTQVS